MLDQENVQSMYIHPFMCFISICTPHNKQRPFLKARSRPHPIWPDDTAERSFILPGSYYMYAGSLKFKEVDMNHPPPFPRTRSVQPLRIVAFVLKLGVTWYSQEGERQHRNLINRPTTGAHH